MGRKPASTPEEFAQAVNSEIRGEMGKSDTVRSNRALAAALGVSSDYVNKRVGNKTPWDLADLEKLGVLFGLEPWVFIDRARAHLAIASGEVASLDDYRRRAEEVPAVPDDVAAYDEEHPSGYDIQVDAQDADAEAGAIDVTDSPTNGDEGR